jgi:hypothetical protein
MANVKPSQEFSLSLAPSDFDKLVQQANEVGLNPNDYASVLLRHALSGFDAMQSKFDLALERMARPTEEMLVELKEIREQLAGLREDQKPKRPDYTLGHWDDKPFEFDEWKRG